MNISSQGIKSSSFFYKPLMLTFIGDNKEHLSNKEILQRKRENSSNPKIKTICKMGEDELSLLDEAFVNQPKNALALYNEKSSVFPQADYCNKIKGTANANKYEIKISELNARAEADRYSEYGNFPGFPGLGLMLFNYMNDAPPEMEFSVKRYVSAEKDRIFEQALKDIESINNEEASKKIAKYNLAQSLSDEEFQKYSQMIAEDKEKSQTK